MDNYTLDLYYTMHFPLTEKYIALYPKSEIGSQEVLDKREQIRQQLREKMLYGKTGLSGSNKVKLGTKSYLSEKREKGASDDDGDDVEESSEDEIDEHEEDEFLDLGRKKC